MTSSNNSYQIEWIDKLAIVDKNDWNRLAGDSNPFLRYEFLSALETTGCVGEGTGWVPRYVVLVSDNRLAGAIPLYEKYDSYGEYVFDWAWANAYQQHGLNYYPKLVAAIPFTPVTGSRILVDPDLDQNAAKIELVNAVSEKAKSSNVSSLHWLFIPESETELLEQHDHLRRAGYQFHWTNNNYQSFDDFLAGFSSAKRKKVRRERRFVSEAGIEMKIIEGTEMTEDLWRQLYAFYRSTIECRGAIPYLSLPFFLEIGQTMADHIVVIMARHEDQYVAGALNLKGSDTLYGRYWGALAEFNSLHFETCYYQAIDYCIEHRLYRYEAGAQGEHKLSRGFLPTRTYSAHWLKHPEFYRAISDFLEREHQGVEEYMSQLQRHSPYKQED